ncbi:UNVERIFIED_CONTAM: hypothetical protein GTU68_051066 [Idotea baltica]|nr:hypothetical protein [Idotea baltica]
MSNFDVIVLGSGPGGYVTAIRASQLGLKTAIIEKENLGGVCLNWGCIPTKALLKSAQVFDYLKHASDYGLKAEGVDKDFEAVVKRSRNVADGMSKGVQFLMKKNKIEVIKDIVLSAVGIKSNIENIGLENVGIKTDRDKIVVDANYKTNIEGYYAIGDVTPGQALAHVASAEGILCVENIAGMHVEALDYGNIPGCTYCIPEIASVGLTEKQAKEKGLDIKVGKFPFSASGKAKASGASDGFVKVIFDAKYGEWLGCHMIGVGVTDMIAEAVVARKLETTGHEILKAVHPHPTMSEAVMEAVAAAYDEVIHL